MRKYLAAIAAWLLLTSCHQSTNLEVDNPKKLDDGWSISAPGAEGFGEDALKGLIKNIPQANPKLDAVVIARHNKLIVDQYYNGYSADKLHKIWSITKAISGTLLGIAKDKGLLSEKDSIYKYMGNYSLHFSPASNAITIEHLITMTSGIEWNELGGPQSASFRLPYSNDWIEFILSQPLTNAPGEKFNYSSGNSMLLSPIIKSATGEQAVDFAEANLFSLLGITHYEWDKQSEFWTKTEGSELPGAKSSSPPIEYKKPFADLTNTGSGLHMLPRDLCKIGQLYLNNGKWNGKQVVSEEWIVQSTQPHFNNNEYGYHWRLMNFGDKPCYYATGFGLQRIFVLPALDMVIVTTQQHYDSMPQGEKWTNDFVAQVTGVVKN